MSRSNLFLTALFAMWILPAFAAAQDEIPGQHEIHELRSDDPRCPEGNRCFIAGSLASYEQMLSRVNGHEDDESRRVTFSQFAAANPCRVIFHRADGERRLNGTCSFNRSSEPVTERDFCAGHTCERWIMASAPGHVTIYRVPAVRRLTPSERAEEMVRTLNAIDPVTRVVPAPTELGGMLTELAGLMDEAQPPSRAQEHEVVLAMGRALERAAPASVPAASALPSHATSASDAAELENLRQQITTLTAERDSARVATNSTVPTWYLWLVLLAALIGIAGTYFFMRNSKSATAPANESDEDDEDIEELRQKKQTAEFEYDNVKSQLSAINDVYKTETGEVFSLDKLKARLKAAKPLGEIWAEVKKGALDSQKGIERLLMLVAKLPELVAKDALVALVNGSLTQLQLQAAASAFEGHLERAVKNAEERGREEGHAKLESSLSSQRAQLEEQFNIEREALAKRAGSSSEDLDRAKAELVRANERAADLDRENRELMEQREALATQSTIDGAPILAKLEEKVRGPIHDLARGVWAGVFGHHEVTKRKVVDEKLLLQRFSLFHPRVIVLKDEETNGHGKRSRNGRGAIPRTMRELKESEFAQFAHEFQEAFDAVMSGLVEILGSASGGLYDLTPLPGSFPTAGLPIEARESSASGPGQDDLLANPDDSPTIVRGSAEEPAVDATQGMSAEAVENGAASELEAEGTSMFRNPFADGGEEAKPRRTSDADVTLVVKRDPGQERPRKDTLRGIPPSTDGSAQAASPSEPPGET